MRKCKKCRKLRSLENFKNREDRPGKYAWCNKCRAEQGRVDGYPLEQDTGGGRLFIRHGELD